MSPDDIFAAQMWQWPEPSLKRDAMGRVLFVNAAFLQMYGGQVEDWRGNIVTGWPAPQPPGVPYRFETRLPSEAGEQVYDWMEFTMADGNAFAMARNVTYLFQAPEPDPGITEEPPYVEPQQEQAIVVPSIDDNVASTQVDEISAFAENTTQEPVYQEPVYQEPVYQEPAHQEPILQAPVDAPAVQSYVTESHETVADITAEVAADPVFDSASYSDLTQESVEPSHLPEAAPETVPAPNTTERAYERRALPIENDEAVLGNNWRDAVIAKAVGAEAPSAEEVSEQELPVASEDESGTIRILLAEDNAINALLTRTLLEAEGHSVETVEDGLLAVEAMKSSKYDLIFMDMRMPNMDGLEATRKIRSMDNVSKGLPIIALTANAFDDDRNACFDSGMNDFMTKPVSAEELSEMVRTWTKNKAERDAA